MIFRVGPFEYSLKILRRVTDDQGRETLGLAVYLDREIRISARVPAASRLDILLHEIWHCWSFHFPIPADEESRCDMNAAVTASAIRDLAEQGGVEALIAMSEFQTPVRDLSYVPAVAVAPGDAEPADFDPLGQTEAWETTAEPSGGRAECGQCCTLIADGSIVSEPPRWHARHGGLVMRRTLYCPHCDAIQSWLEGAKITGEPNGAVIGEPGYSRGSAVIAFLREHPQAVGMMV